MSEFDATEQAYRNGYEAGKADALKWISIKDRLPKPFVPVLGYMPQRISENIEILYRTRKKLWYSQEHGDGFFGTPSHWMPLPQPPEVEE